MGFERVSRRVGLVGSWVLGVLFFVLFVLGVDDPVHTAISAMAVCFYICASGVLFFQSRLDGANEARNARILVHAQRTTMAMALFGAVGIVLWPLQILDADGTKQPTWVFALDFLHWVVLIVVVGVVAIDAYFACCEPAHEEARSVGV